MHDWLKIRTNADEKEDHPLPFLHENDRHKPQIFYSDTWATISLRISDWNDELKALSDMESVSHWVVSDCLQPHGLWPARFLCPWNSPGKNTGVGWHFLLHVTCGTKMTEKSASERKKTLGTTPWKVESQEKHGAFFQFSLSLKKKKYPGHLNSAFYPSYVSLPLVWCYFSFFFLFLSSESILTPLPLLPYFRICLHLGSLFSLPCFNFLRSSWIPRPQRVGSRPIKFSVSAANSVPRTIRYLIALWWLWLMMFSTYTNSGEKHTSPIRWVAYKWLLQKQNCNKQFSKIRSSNFY